MFITDLQWPATYCSGFLYAGWLISSHCIVCYYLQHYIFLAVVLSIHSNSTFYLLSCILTYIVQCKHLLNLEVSQENVSGLCKTGYNSYVLLRCLEKVLASEKPLSVSMSKNNMHCAFTKIVVNESELSGITQPLTNKDREVNLGSKHLSFQEKQKTDDHPSPIHPPFSSCQVELLLWKAALSWEWSYLLCSKTLLKDIIVHFLNAFEHLFLTSNFIFRWNVSLVTHAGHLQSISLLKPWTFLTVDYKSDHKSTANV